LKPDEISDGKIQDTSGEVIYKVKFKALVFRPFRGEILDGIVSEVSSNGILIESGPLKSFITKDVLIHIILICLENEERV
jgi:DNA-directed RNA polymerase II subunit RPB7